MDREITSDVRRKRLIRRLLTSAAAVGAVVIAFIAIVAWLSPSVRRNDLQFARVTRGDVDSTVQASGIIVPALEQVVSSPVEARVLRIDHRAGDRVRAGDELLTLDNQITRLDLERTQERLAKTNNENSQLQLDIEEQIASVAAELEQRKLDGEILRFKADQTAKLRAEGLTADQEALAAATAAKKSAIEIAQLEQKLARMRRSTQAKLAAASLDASMLRKERDESQRQLELAMLRADRDGVITWMIEEQGATVRRGDVLARIADLSAFRVAATISDLFVPRIAAGMPVHVRLDDATTVDGTLTSIDPRIENGIARLNVMLDPAARGQLHNNVRVDVYIVTGRRSNVLKVKKGSLQASANENVFVVRGDALVRVPVKFGLTGEKEIEIASGVREGDTVVISDMSDYEGLKEIRLK